MLILVATKDGQGKRGNDFCWTEEGEPVRFTFECDGEKVDGSCGCRRSFAGIRSSRATTTAKVVESDLTMSDYVSLIGDKRGALELLRIAKSFKLGDIVEKRGTKIQTRGV